MIIYSNDWPFDVPEAAAEQNKALVHAMNIAQYSEPTLQAIDQLYLLTHAQLESAKAALGPEHKWVKKASDCVVRMAIELIKDNLRILKTDLKDVTLSDTSFANQLQKRLDAIEPFLGMNATRSTKKELKRLHDHLASNMESVKNRNKATDEGEEADADNDEEVDSFWYIFGTIVLVAIALLFVVLYNFELEINAGNPDIWGVICLTAFIVYYVGRKAYKWWNRH